MPHNTRSWPNLFIIGAMKSGTSYLHSVLDEHPDIFMCRPKEPAYYADGHRLFAGDAAPGGPVTAPFGSSERRVTYQAMFAAGAGARWRGESSTVYTKRPRHEGIAARIAADCPDARLIYVMRDPVDRIVSHYFHQIGLTEEPGTLLEAVERDPTYVAFSNYAYQLEPYLEHFPASQIHVLTYESLVADPSTAVRDIFRWLDVPDDVPLSDLERRVNGGLDELPATTPLMATLARLNLRTLRSPRLAWYIGRLGGRRRREDIDVSADRAVLRHRLAPLVAELEALLGRSFPEWPTGAAMAAVPDDTASVARP